MDGSVTYDQTQPFDIAVPIKTKRFLPPFHQCTNFLPRCPFKANPRRDVA